MSNRDRCVAAALALALATMTALTTTSAMGGNDAVRYIDVTSDSRAPIGWVAAHSASM